jgi:hypothetical protein
VLGGVDGNLHFPVQSITGSIKPSLQHFQFCSVGLSLGILYLSILLQFQNKKMHGVLVRSRAKLISEGAKPSRYFCIMKN